MTGESVERMHKLHRVAGTKHYKFIGPNEWDTEDEAYSELPEAGDTILAHDLAANLGAYVAPIGAGRTKEPRYGVFVARHDDEPLDDSANTITPASVVSLHKASQRRKVREAEEDAKAAAIPPVRFSAK